jgi:hypothetical protein
MLVEGMSKDLRSSSFVIKEGAPNPFHFLILKTASFILVVKTCKEPSIEAHICKDPWSSIRMTEWINVPSNTRSNSEFFHQKVVTLLHVIDKVIKRWASFI